MRKIVNKRHKIEETLEGLITLQRKYNMYKLEALKDQPAITID